jgi:hypothetical protein
VAWRSDDGQTIYQVIGQLRNCNDTLPASYLLTTVGPALGGALGTDAHITVSVPKVTWIAVESALSVALREMDAETLAGHVGDSNWLARMGILRALRHTIQAGMYAANPPDPGQ